MKTEDERLKEIFYKNLEGQGESIPDFDPMWQQAARSNWNKKLRVLKIAASVALFIVAGVFAILIHQNNEAGTSIPIASWKEPTKSLVLPVTETGALTQWSSPTDFLLPENNQR